MKAIPYLAVLAALGVVGAAAEPSNRNNNSRRTTTTRQLQKRINQEEFMKILLQITTTTTNDDSASISSTYNDEDGQQQQEFEYTEYGGGNNNNNNNNRERNRNKQDDIIIPIDLVKDAVQELIPVTEEIQEEVWGQNDVVDGFTTGGISGGSEEVPQQQDEDEEEVLAGGDGEDSDGEDSSSSTEREPTEPTEEEEEANDEEEEMVEDEVEIGVHVVAVGDEEDEKATDKILGFLDPADEEEDNTQQDENKDYVGDDEGIDESLQLPSDMPSINPPKWDEEDEIDTFPDDADIELPSDMPSINPPKWDDIDDGEVEEQRLHQDGYGNDDAELPSDMPSDAPSSAPSEEEQEEAPAHWDDIDDGEVEEQRLHQDGYGNDDAELPSDMPSDAPSSAPSEEEQEEAPTAQQNDYVMSRGAVKFATRSPTVSPGGDNNNNIVQGGGGEVVNFQSGTTGVEDDSTTTVQFVKTNRQPTAAPSLASSLMPSDVATSMPSDMPSLAPSDMPSLQPSNEPASETNVQETEAFITSAADGKESPDDANDVDVHRAPPVVTIIGNVFPISNDADDQLTAGPSTTEPTGSPSAGPTPSPTASPSEPPTASPSAGPTSTPTGFPSTEPTVSPTDLPTASPSAGPTPSPTASPSEPPTGSPSAGPTSTPTGYPSTEPTASPTDLPTASPSAGLTASPSVSPTVSPTSPPSAGPTSTPSASPTLSPTSSPTASPSDGPTSTPTDAPSSEPTPKATSLFESAGLDFHGTYAATDYISCDGGKNRIYPAITQITVKYPYSLRVDYSNGLRDASAMQPAMTRIEQDLLKQLLPTLCENQNFLSASVMPYDAITDQFMCTEVGDNESPSDPNACYDVEGVLSMRLADNGVTTMPDFYCDTLKEIEAVFSNSQLAGNSPDILAAEFKSADNSILSTCHGTPLGSRTASDSISSEGTLNSAESYIGIAVAGVVVLFMASMIGRKISQRYRLSSDQADYEIRRTDSQGSDRSLRSMISIIFVPAAFKLRGQQPTRPDVIESEEDEGDDDDGSSTDRKEFLTIKNCPTDDIPLDDDDGSPRRQVLKEAPSHVPSPSSSLGQQQPRRVSEENNIKKTRSSWTPSNMTV